jgi:hypothetical protein
MGKKSNKKSTKSLCDKVTEHNLFNDREALTWIFLCEDWLHSWRCSWTANTRFPLRKGFILLDGGLMFCCHKITVNLLIAGRFSNGRGIPVLLFEKRHGSTTWSLSPSSLLGLWLVQIQTSSWLGEEFIFCVSLTQLFHPSLSCVPLIFYSQRTKWRLQQHDDDSEEFLCDKSVFSNIITVLSQIIFTVECSVKILAEGYDPAHFFTDKKNGRWQNYWCIFVCLCVYFQHAINCSLFVTSLRSFSWNCLDFFVVTMGYVEMSPLSFVLNSFPVVILRLLRLLRVFRLAKALPRLRNIVEALISGVSAVGWICVLIVSFNCKS